MNDIHALLLELTSEIVNKLNYFLHPQQDHHKLHLDYLDFLFIIYTEVSKQKLHNYHPTLQMEMVYLLTTDMVTDTQQLKAEPST